MEETALERDIKRAIRCVEDPDKDMQRWFKARTGMTPREFIDKWERKLNGK
ncbi:hypothetical protein [Lactobacillus sp. HT06-2]|uniref:hypothetical protein n=1 Tax=Lactobacillus sp. HT06-2 TaxID=2080222 RepID=UPI001374828A|nr:hypothetical protein [Lactobacillus sp. HT06-2]